MKQSVRLGRIRGIEIGANWSLLVIAGLLTWLLAAEVLPTAVPDFPEGAYWSTALATAALFFASLIAHEMGHALVARRHQVEVKRITLWLFGGVAQLENDSTDPKAELRIGGVGPLVSLVIGIVALGGAFVADLLPRLDLLAAALGWVGLMNLVLGVFNMLPAFPLDGGRVLRAFLWHRSGDRVQATQRAGRVGELAGYLMAGGGLVLLWSGFLVDGLWFALLGWFLVQAARMEVATVTQTDLLRGLRVEQIMSRDPVVVPAELTVDRFIDDFLFRARHSAYPVVDATGQVVGLLTLDCIRPLDPSLRAMTTVGSIAVPRTMVPAVAPADLVADVLNQLVMPGPGRALVLDRGRLVGIVTQKDVAATLQVRALAAPGPRTGGPTGGATGGAPSGRPGEPSSGPPPAPVA